MSKQARTITVYGRVQNVGFRYYTQRTAKQFGITGFVKNQADGSVYIEAEGEPESVQLFVEWCKAGPDHAYVSSYTIEDCPIIGYTGFEIRR